MPIDVKFIPTENTVHLIVSKDDFVKNVNLALQSFISLRKLEASPQVPIFSLFEYTGRIILANNATDNLKTKRFSDDLRSVAVKI